MSEINTASHLLPAGTELNNKYEIINLIGEGGFGITYLGHNKILDIPVAIKEYYPQGYASRIVSQNLTVTITNNTKNAYFDKWKMKFLAEARILAKFANLPGIVNVYDFFEQNGTAYIIMEYLHGITLKNYVEKNGPMDTSTVFKRLIPVLTSLEKIHKQGLIHRDISPDNLMLMNDGFLKLYDFGAAREYSDATQQNFSVIIKPCFAPEEQYRSKGVQGPWTDVYSICATIYFSITGVVPDDSLQRAFSDELKKPSELGVNISPKIEAALLKGMSVRSADRFDSVLPLISAFEEADSKPIKKKGFGKGKKTKGQKTPNIFSIFRTSSQQVASKSTSPPVSNSANDKTEIILNTEYEPSGDRLYTPADNEVKRSPKLDLANNQLHSPVVYSNVIHSEQAASSSSTSKSAANMKQVAQSVQKVSANYARQKNLANSVVAITSDGDIAENNKAGNNTQYSGQRNGGNETRIVCPKCKSVLPGAAKFCGLCGVSLLSFKNFISNKEQAASSNNISTSVSNRGQVVQSIQKMPANSAVQKKSGNSAISATSDSNIAANNKAYNKTQSNGQRKRDNKTEIVCPKCNAVLPSTAQFCGICGVLLSSFPTNSST